MPGSKRSALPAGAAGAKLILKGAVRGRRNLRIVDCIARRALLITAMLCSDSSVRHVVRKCTDPKSRPTLEEIKAFSSLTHNGNAIKVIQRMLSRRLDPKAYVIPEVENTMLMLKDCLATTSDDFVTYVRRDLVPLISQFHSKEAVNLFRVRQAAGNLLDILRDDGLNGQKKQPDIHFETDRDRDHHRNDVTTRTNVQPNSPEVPIITSSITPSQSPFEREYREKEVVPSTAIGHTGLQTPTTSPAGRTVRLSTNSRPPSSIAALDGHGLRIAEQVRALTSNTPQAATTAQLDAVVNMTYDPKELEVVLTVIDARLEALKSQQTYFHLVKTLTLMHHCLTRSSIEFVESCVSRQSVIQNLRHVNGLNDAVRSQAKVVLDLLEDKSCLYRERANRQVLQRPLSSLPNVKRSSTHVELSPHSSPKSEKRRSLLESADAPPIVEKLGEHATCSGGYSDVWKGRLSLDHGATYTLVAVKVLRLTSRAKDSERTRIISRLEREVRVWRKLEHESVAEFYGVIYDSNDAPAIISPWYDKGSADVYLRNHPNEDPMRILWEIVLGIEHLHGCNVVHGDIKGRNVMIDITGHAKLIDFGLSRILDSVGSGLTTSSVSFSIRWCAPELMQSDGSPATKASDVYAFASTALELITGELPYKSMKDVAVIMAVANGVPPKRPESSQRCPQQFWGVLDICWKQASHRPTITDVKAQIRAFYRYSR